MRRLVVYLFGLLLVLMGCTTAGERARMRAGLDSINVLNRTDQPFTMQDVEPLVHFFDDHGTPNDQVLAHYLLGRAYYKHGEAPMALKCYQDAVELADTTAADCDYNQLSRVYGQMANIFYYQGLYRQQIVHSKHAEKFAWKGKDTLAALMCYEQQRFAYQRLEIIDSAIFITENVAHQYKKYGYYNRAAVALGTNVRDLIEKGEFAKAKSYMNQYESKSGYFDSMGNIVPGREIYYKSKGLYYLNTNALDSAEYYFRKELHDGRDFNNQNAAAKGLTMLYQKRYRPDSIAKYAVYAYDMSDSLYAQKNVKEVKRIQAMYDYSRQQEIARQETEKTTQANRMLLFSLIALLTISLIASWLYFARVQLIKKLQQVSIELTAAREELAELQQDSSVNHQSIMEKEERIKQLERKLGKYGKIVYFGAEKIENDLQLSPNYQKIKDLAYKGRELQQHDWDIIYQLINEYLPGYHDFLTSKLKINTADYQVCLLLRLHFKAGEIANMLGVSPPYISKICTTIFAVLFNKKGSSRELAKELAKIN
ncbi:hypothetical protein [Prevotella sp. tc2-28]|uniref:hypothetical protein n=1 Tax=Prevotella sp. tc2-28 TaxID=1761888 RepID=UPI000B85375F|nr:hypothetical protein [Prevotella sp. tc2-28]